MTLEALMHEIRRAPGAPATAMSHAADLIRMAKEVADRDFDGHIQDDPRERPRCVSCRIRAAILAIENPA